jgi:phosphoglycerate dehydrogenase-like enzyme
MDKLEERGVAVTNASGVHGPNIAEHVVGSLLIFSRRFHKAWRLKQDNQWRHFQGYELEGSTVTVVGLGAIGTAICQRLESFNVRRIGIRHSPEKNGPVEEVHGYDTAGFNDALSRSDYVVLACPLTELTDSLIDRETLVTVPTDAVIVNVARGGVVDTDALVEGLRKGELRGAALDVTDPEPLPGDHPLWDLDNVLITPHNAGNTPNYFDRLSGIVKRNVEVVRDTGQFDNLENQVI